MTIGVLLVDDSAVIRKLLSAALTQGGDVIIVGEATDGEQAIAAAKRTQPDIIILDIEMPTMDGLTALPYLLDAAPKARIIVVSRLTHKNAEISMQALESGASDYIAKPEMDGLERFYRELIMKVRALAPAQNTRKILLTSNVATPQPVTAMPRSAKPKRQPIHALAIAASTGGPQALLELFEDLGGRLTHIPIFITQHMPVGFLQVFSGHLSTAGKMPCAEGKEGELVAPGRIFIAPGDHHMTVQRVGSQVVIHTNQDKPENYCRPAADPMFRALSAAYGPNLLALVLTGMGQDGANGAEIIAKNGGEVVAQDAASSVVYGMPKAVADRGICQEILPLDRIAEYLLKRCAANHNGS